MSTDTNNKGKVTIEELEAKIARIRQTMAERDERIARMETDEDDCFMSIKAEANAIDTAQKEIDILKRGGTGWFDWYTDMNGVVCKDARWVQTKYGSSLVVEFEDGRTVWTTAQTAKGLAKKGLRKVRAKFPVWVKTFCNGTGLAGAYCSYVREYRAALNRATGEYHPAPYEIEECEDED